MKNEYVQAIENELRKKDYYKQPEDEAFLRDLNLSLGEFEREFLGEYKIEKPYIFVLGLPRSGTTLLTQILTHGLDVGYINNFIARFWRAPITGIKLSKNLFSDSKTSNFESDFGKTTKITDPHEFAYFWHHWLLIKEKQDGYIPGINTSRINWSGLENVLANIQREFNKPVVMKNIIGANYINEITNIIDKVLWIYIKREPNDVCWSLLKVRKKYYSDISNWWGTFPPEYEKLKDLPPKKQITGQVRYLNEYYDNQLEKIDESILLKIDYKDICIKPSYIIEVIAKKIPEIYSCDINLSNKLPNKFKYTTYSKEFI